MSRLLFCDLLITVSVIAGFSLGSGRKIIEDVGTAATLSFIPSVSSSVSSSDWKLNLAFLRDFRDGVQVLSVAGRPVSDGVHVVGGVGGPPPSSLASLHPHQQESKRQRMTEPHNMPQLRIDTREAKVTTGEIE